MQANMFAGQGGQKTANSQQAGSPNAGGGSRRTQPLRPLTINQLTGAQQVAGEGAIVIDGVDLGSVTVVGRVVAHDSEGSAAGTAKSHGYKVADTTGVISVRHWIDNSATEAEVQVAVGEFVRCTGTVKMWQGKPVVTGGVRQCTNTTEQEYHYLDCILTHNRLTKGHKPIGSSAATAPTTTAASGTGVNYQAMSCPDAIERCIKLSGDKTEGLSVDQISAQVGTVFTFAEVRDSIRIMINEGRLFATAGNKYTC